tara:strand:+ start:352 stop:645 length:294 start_codon:yes stop_codon:yes gene_type:complete
MRANSFRHPVDTWSSTLGEAEEHARFHGGGVERDSGDWIEPDCDEREDSDPDELCCGDHVETEHCSPFCWPLVMLKRQEQINQEKGHASQEESSTER